VEINPEKTGGIRSGKKNGVAGNGFGTGGALVPSAWDVNRACRNGSQPVAIGPGFFYRPIHVLMNPPSTIRAAAKRLADPVRRAAHAAGGGRARRVGGSGRVGSAIFRPESVDARFWRADCLAERFGSAGEHLATSRGLAVHGRAGRTGKSAMAWWRARKGKAGAGKLALGWPGLCLNDEQGSRRREGGGRSRRARRGDAAG